jgi:hypothetical protein
MLWDGREPATMWAEDIVGSHYKAMISEDIAYWQVVACATLMC